MIGPRTYLDHNATSPLRPEGREAVARALDVLGNPSSVHTEGRRARGLIEAARERVARLVNARASEVVFTSGATEANNWVTRAHWDSVFTSAMEHDSILAPARASGSGFVLMPAKAQGIADIEAFARLFECPLASSERALLALQFANNETGVVQPVAAAVELARARNFSVHSDVVQAAGRMPVDFAALGVDTMSLSSHKLGGPTGAGALIIRDGFELRPLILGGGQERRRRAGTENLLAVTGFGAAAEAAHRDLGHIGRIAALRDRLERGLLQITPEAVIIGREVPRIANTTCVALARHTAETLVIKLDLAGIAVSAGSACSSGKVGASSVLAAMGLSPDLAKSAIRISLGWSTSDRDVEAFLGAWNSIADTARQRTAA